MSKISHCTNDNIITIMTIEKCTDVRMYDNHDNHGLVMICFLLWWAFHCGAWITIIIILLFSWSIATLIILNFISLRPQSMGCNNPYKRSSIFINNFQNPPSLNTINILVLIGSGIESKISFFFNCVG